MRFVSCSGLIGIPADGRLWQKAAALFLGAHAVSANKSRSGGFRRMLYPGWRFIGVLKKAAIFGGWFLIYLRHHRGHCVPPPLPFKPAGEAHKKLGPAWQRGG